MSAQSTHVLLPVTKESANEQRWIQECVLAIQMSLFKPILFSHYKIKG
jgi:hypothetical protein